MHSEGTGQGSEFTVRLPAIEPVAAAAVNVEPPERRPDSRYILIVEDNADSRDTLRMVLELSGHRVETAADGRPGEVLAYQVGAAMARSGVHVAVEVLTSGRPLTGYGAPEDRERALAAGFDTHVVKPVDDRTLAEILSSSEAEAS